MSSEHMSEANFGLETRQPVTPEVSMLNQEGIVVFEKSSGSSNVFDKFTIGFHNTVDRFKTVAKQYGAVPAVGAIAFIAACSGGDKNPDISINTQTSTPTAGASLEPTPRITPTESTKTTVPLSGGGGDGKFPTPTATSTPEVKKDTPCLIIATELCKSAELLDVQVGNQVIKAIGFNLPVRTQILASRDGQIFKSEQKDSSLKGFSVLVGDAVPDKSSPSFRLVGDLAFVDTKSSVNAGQVIATIQNRGIQNLGSYNLIVLVNTLSTDNPEAALKELFPDAFSKPAKKVSLDQAENPTPTYTGSQVIDQ